jgi:hypothetical protein
VASLRHQAAVPAPDEEPAVLDPSDELLVDDSLEVEVVEDPDDELLDVLFEEPDRLSFL